jgi:hypothetical protein
MKNHENINPEFFLTSTEIQPTLIPRKCWILEKLWSEERKINFLRIRIDPPIHGQHFKVEQDLIDELAIATRHANTSLCPLSAFPITVYICYVSNSSIRHTGKVTAKDLRIMFIGEVYKTLADAEKAIRHEERRI